MGWSREKETKAIRVGSKPAFLEVWETETSEGKSESRLLHRVRIESRRHTFMKTWKADKARYKRIYKQAMWFLVAEATSFYLQTGKRLRERKRSISPELRQKILSRYGPTCQLCGISLQGKKDGTFIFEAHHIYPESLGGRAWLDNLVPLCPKCNRTLQSLGTLESPLIRTKL